MTLDNDDSVFVEALRADLPSAEQQERMRRRLLAVGSGLATSSAAAVARASWGSALVAKVGALSWPATLVLAATLTTPVVALPWLLTPAVSTRSPARLPVRPGASSRRVTSEPTRLPMQPAAGEATSAAELADKSTSVAVRGTGQATGKNLAGAVAVSVERPAVAAFDPVHESEGNAGSPRAASTLAAETELLDRAFAELAADNQAVAAVLIAQHERQFPNGLLRQERERAKARLKQDFKPE